MSLFIIAVAEPAFVSQSFRTPTSIRTNQRCKVKANTIANYPAVVHSNIRQMATSGAKNARGVSFAPLMKPSIKDFNMRRR